MKLSFFNVKLGFILIAIAFIHSSVAQDYVSIICPAPNDKVEATEEECVNFTACEYSSELGRCHMKSNAEAGYVIGSSPIPTDTGFMWVIQKTETSLTLYNDDIQDLFLEVIYHDDQHFQIKIIDPVTERYEIPFKLNLDPQTIVNPLYEVSVGEPGGLLNISVVRSSNQNSVFQTIGPLTYENQFIQFTTTLASGDLYGLGENYHTTLKHSFDERKTYPLFASDKSTIDPGQYNHYGVHPYYVNVEDDDGNTHSVLFYNSNAMEYSTFLLDDGVTPAITFRTIGGIIDLHFFLGPTPEDVNVQYMNTIGLPAMPPYWSMGFTLSRWGYESTANYRIVRERMINESIPMDVQTFDIDFMDGRRDFTYDPVDWADLPELIEELHADNVKVTLITDAAVALYYGPSERGLEQDAFVKWAFEGLVPDDQPEIAGNNVVGKVWPDNHTVFPDFFNSNGNQWWISEFEIFHSILDFDAIWIDMNEPSNFGTNTYDGVNTMFCANDTYNSPPYPTRATFNDRNPTQRLSEKTICMTASHTDGSNNYLHYDVHNLYGMTEAMATKDAAEALFPGMRHLVLGRSTFVGSGRYAIHWLGDNGATWDQMKVSIIGMIEFNMFGIPMVGADICGFDDEPTMELCGRWMQLGSFYPYSRNHNAHNIADQDPAVWPEVAAISRIALSLRYSRLPFLFSLLFRSHMDGHTVIRPLFNVFPSDLNCRDIDDQFFWGDAMMIAPIIVEGTLSRDVYFPDSLWYDLVEGYLVMNGSGTKNVLADDETTYPVFIRGGKIIPFQGSGLTTTESRLTNFGFTIALDADNTAVGELFWDDGVTDRPTSETFHMVMAATPETSSDEINIKSAITTSSDDVEDALWDTITVYGVGCPCGYGITYPSEGDPYDLDITCDLSNRMVTIKTVTLDGLPIALPISSEIDISISSFNDGCA